MAYNHLKCHLHDVTKQHMELMQKKSHNMDELNSRRDNNKGCKLHTLLNINKKTNNTDFTILLLSSSGFVQITFVGTYYIMISLIYLSIKYMAL